MKDNNKLSNMLKKEGLKSTKHRAAILEILDETKEPLSAEDIFLRCKEKNLSISLSTVYRILDILTSKGLIDALSVPNDNKALYQLQSRQHKHHLVCVGCRKLIDFDYCPMQQYEDSIKNDLDFDITGHKLEIYGYCKDCKNSKIK